MSEVSSLVIAAYNAGRSFRDIGDEFNLSRSAIGGLVYRARARGEVIGKRSSKMPVVEVRVKKRPAAKPAPQQQAARVIQLFGDYEPKRVPFLDIESGQCRWPMWAAGTPFSDKVYCGADAEPGQSYCGHCEQIAYNPQYTKVVDGRLGILKLRKAA